MDGHSRQVSLSGSGPSVFSLINSGDFGFFDEKLTRSGIRSEFSRQSLFLLRSTSATF